MKINVIVNLTQLVKTMHNIYKVSGSNSGHHKKNENELGLTCLTRNLYMVELI